ncbi:MAG TPA: methyltransferase domain-containing protein [Woeseiaceae bacterium]|nr:methyltransferase domain-containing protein [Woeseiaceae bacterium]
MTLRKWTDHIAYTWLQSPPGQALLTLEARLAEELLDGVFGEEALQIGLWGDRHTFLRYSRTQRSALLADTLWDLDASAGTLAVGELHRLPIASDSVDSVILPHSLDFSDRPQAILREVHRVLRADGHLLLLGFRPGGLWGLRRLVPGAGMPPGAEDLLSDRRLKDWLRLLDMRILSNRGYFFRWPLPGGRTTPSVRWEQRGQRWWPELSACYMLSAQKRINTLTPVRPVWSKTRQVVAGLAEPSTRTLSTQTSRTRFERKHRDLY